MAKSKIVKFGTYFFSILLVFMLIPFVASFLKKAPPENPADFISDTIEIPELSSKILVKYPKQIKESWDGKYRPKIYIELLSGKDNIDVYSESKIITDLEGKTWSGRGFEHFVLKPGKPATINEWFKFDRAKQLSVGLRFYEDGKNKVSSGSRFIYKSYHIEIGL